VKAKKKGIINIIDNSTIGHIARAAGAPHNKGAGIYMHKKLSDTVKKGDKLFTIYAESEPKLNHAIEVVKEKDAIIIQ
jgi:thymidine phosphorylase